MNLIERNIRKLKKLCDKYNVSRLYVFGSVINKKFKKDSDIDFLVTFDAIELSEYADNYFDFKFSLEDLFNRKIIMPVTNQNKAAEEGKCSGKSTKECVMLEINARKVASNK